MEPTGSDLDEPDRVAPGFACPACGEADIDKLEWVSPPDADEERVRCATCGTEYSPGVER